MKNLTIFTLCICSTVLTPSASAEPVKKDHTHVEPDSSKPVNTMCPIGKEPIVEGIQTIVYKGDTLGFCCMGCSDEFMAWEESAKDNFVANAKNNIYSFEGAQADQPAAGAQPVSIPYPFNTCPISGEDLGTMGEPIVKTYNSREVKFCCQMCVPRFEKDLVESLAKIDQQIIDDQLPLYPTTSCVVSDQVLGSEDMGDPINIVFNNRLVRLCCKMCVNKFDNDPQGYIAKLDEAVIAQQIEHYPLSVCPISGEPLGSMGDAIKVVYQGRLVKLCCQMCVPNFESNPMPTIKKIDAAWEKMHPNSVHQDD